MRCLTANHAREFPAEIIDVLNATIRTPRAEGRHQVRRIADKNHALVHEALHTSALKRIEADPFVFELDIRSQHGAHLRGDILLPQGRRAINIPSQLKVETPDTVWLLVHERRAAGVEGCVEIEATLGRKRRLHPDVRDQKIVFEETAFELEPEQRP